jgi:hypothetical protein
MAATSSSRRSISAIRARSHFARDVNTGIQVLYDDEHKVAPMEMLELC